MAVAVDGTNDRLKAALSVDGGVRSGGRVYAGDASGSAGRYNAAVSHRLEAITTIRAGVMTSRDGSDCSMDDSDCLLRLSEDGVSAGYALRPGDSDVNRAGDSHGYRVMNGTYHASVGMGDRGANDLYEMKIAAGDAPIGTIEAAASTFGSGCVRAAVIAWDLPESDTIYAGVGSTRAGGSTWNLPGDEEGIGTVRAMIGAG